MTAGAILFPGFRSAEEFFSLALWLAGWGHFCLLFAGLQLPYRLRWNEDLAKLLPFNRKLLWTYGGFTVLTIVAFALLTITLHTELVRGDRAALGLAAFIGVFWAARILVDFFYFRHSYWPRGQLFVLGHVLLTSLFFFLAGTYLGLWVWHIWFR